MTSVAGRDVGATVVDVGLGHELAPTVPFLAWEAAGAGQGTEGPLLGLWEGTECADDRAERRLWPGSRRHLPAPPGEAPPEQCGLFPAEEVRGLERQVLEFTAPDNSIFWKSIPWEAEMWLRSGTDDSGHRMIITTTGGGIVCQLLLNRFTRVFLHPHNPEREMLLLNPFSRWCSQGPEFNSTGFREEQKCSRVCDDESHRTTAVKQEDRRWLGTS
ncbi:uncharacterized protein LOC128315792 [Acinonyx jubatus]|uniref:Uncharacterized protein LOC128315792 n=1 Tax=Acinonyx jubatus TaxID=32536 RepID=A0ABM3Q633_ACIJB|nr:uncharacterized protein LOC128315792 [Acinonyx jubatus]